MQRQRNVSQSPLIPGRIGDTSQKGNWSCFRNELHNGKTLVALNLSAYTDLVTGMQSTKGERTSTQHLEFDFVTTKRPAPPGLACQVPTVSVKRLFSVLETCGLLRSEDRVPALRYLHRCRIDCNASTLANGVAVFETSERRAVQIKQASTMFYANLAIREAALEQAVGEEVVRVDYTVPEEVAPAPAPAPQPRSERDKDKGEEGDKGQGQGQGPRRRGASMRGSMCMPTPAGGGPVRQGSKRLRRNSLLTLADVAGASGSASGSAETSVCVSVDVVGPNGVPAAVSAAEVVRRLLFPPIHAAAAAAAAARAAPVAGDGSSAAVPSCAGSTAKCVPTIVPFASAGPTPLPSPSSSPTPPYGSDLDDQLPHLASARPYPTTASRAQGTATTPKRPRRPSLERAEDSRPVVLTAATIATAAATAAAAVSAIATATAAPGKTKCKTEKEFAAELRLMLQHSRVPLAAKAARVLAYLDDKLSHIWLKVPPTCQLSFQDAFLTVLAFCRAPPTPTAFPVRPASHLLFNISLLSPFAPSSSFSPFHHITSLLAPLHRISHLASRRRGNSAWS